MFKRSMCISIMKFGHPAPKKNERKHLIISMFNSKPYLGASRPQKPLGILGC